MSGRKAGRVALPLVIERERDHNRSDMGLALKSPLACAVALLPVLLMAGCAEERKTGIVVAMASDLTVPTEIDGLWLKVVSQGQTFKDFIYNLDPAKPAAATLPGTRTIYTTMDPSIPVEILVAGVAGRDVTVRREARTWFVHGKLLLLKMYLLRRCLDVSCPADQTCSENGCTSIEIDPRTLPEYDGSPLQGPEAGPPPGDAAAADSAGIDGPWSPDASSADLSPANDGSPPADASGPEDAPREIGAQ